jgi:hypothetical protein
MIQQKSARRVSKRVEPRCLDRQQAAAYCGCDSLSTFADWVRRGIIPGPIPGTHRWDRRAIDTALDLASGIRGSMRDEFDEWKAQRDARAPQRRPLSPDAPR